VTIFQTLEREKTMRPRITNLYAVGALATIGGLIQGIDIASMSAILGTSQVCLPTTPAHPRTPGTREWAS
jgi:hypothetical protein